MEYKSNNISKNKIIQLFLMNNKNEITIKPMLITKRENIK
jgi:hypothetical protein